MSLDEKALYLRINIGKKILSIKDTPNIFFVSVFVTLSVKQFLRHLFRSFFTKILTTFLIGLFARERSKNRVNFDNEKDDNFTE